LLFIGDDPYRREEARVALESHGGWSLRSCGTLDEAVARDLLGDPLISVALVPTEHADALPSVPANLPVLVYGPPAALASLISYRFGDFIAVPWTADELIYRLRKLVRHDALVCADGTLEWGRYWMRATRRDGTTCSIGLPARQHAILDVLGRGGQEPVPREALLAVALIDDPSSRALDMQLSRLRRRLADVTTSWRSQPCIRVYRGVGYRLET
jgi:hypothetical protein